MGLIFREGTPLRNKVILSSFGFYLLFTFIGMYANFLVNEKVYIKLLVLSCIVSAVIISSGLYFVFRSRHSHQMPPLQTKQRVIFVLFLILFVPLFSIFSIAKGLPACIHYTVAKAAQHKVTFRKTTSSKICGYGIKIKEYSYFANEEVCGLEKSRWRKFKDGDTLVLIGKRSLLGFSYVQHREKIGGK
ncbi:hypothetical protein [Pseudoalteromonas maricaloris]|uniref:hypothetical protein n=1 Tax=Pseudoalteromonas maricaloris TaxID=184924 RepID=UPI00057E9574|nr:hypothetical protein [Pseudoalteromonas flavipulchra]KID34808.1 hypothetical protein QT15_17085 [Pseudoalteromonas flavipulchra NCIMB 2033 = ATCC BAA-314]MBD0784028.1 hypothetical protein [Pseudoalteromonas flavipulchra]MBE0372853.1 hypothetical protein [Pseudoalteromonas flavipulchra NCIMB 2033 = ATCC BAA-314]MBE0374637.1 hypothetical protein [Pseudoalteromonas flavipulchra NCIMB 2033 = ATCC BAA-314]USE69234.1 hypothetical protein CTT31_08925 [Pseudoalteromonas flavipulchra]